MSGEKVKIYVQLLDEGTICYRPTEGISVREGVYQLLENYNYDPEDENWEFKPGALVKCEWKTLSEGKAFVAVAKVEE